jgi:DNA-binding transcriptional MerR regulator
MQLILAPKSIEGIKKLLKLRSQKSGQKCLQKSRKWKILQLKIRDDLTKKIAILKQIKSLQSVKTTQSPSCSLKDRGKLSLISSLL